MEQYNEANTYKKRDCYRQLEEYINGGSTKVCILYGLLGTGKSTMMFQAIKDVGLENVGYILCEDGDSYGKLCQKLNEFISQNKKVVFINEITKLSDFITSSASLADYYSGTGTKIVITATDSLGLNLVTCGELYDRTESIHTTYISYGEFSRLTGKTDIDDFIRYAGVLSHEDNENEREFFDGKTASEYIDSAISSNITNTFFKHKLPSNFIHKYDKLIGLHNRNILVPTITAIVETYSYLMTKDTIDSYYKQNSSDDFEVRIVAEINSRDDINDFIEPETVSQIIDYLYDLELIVSIPSVCYIDNAIKQGKKYIYGTNEYIYQAGIKYCHAKSVIEATRFNNDTNLSTAEKEALCVRLEEDIKEQILKISVFHDTINFLDKDKYDIFKMKFAGEKDGEIDMVIYDKQNKEYYCFKVKHSKQTGEQQQCDLLNKSFQNILDINYGTRKINAVLYMGETAASDSNGVTYLNVEDFLSELSLSSEPVIEKVIQNCLSKNRQAL
jgi:hypothetical protein